ncbi:carbohydrate ABC transporter permease [Paenibacillus rhizoplanae]
MDKVLPKLILTVIMGVVALLMLFPIGVTLINSFMSTREIEINYGPVGQMNTVIEGRSDPFANLKWLPDQVSLEQYGKVLLESPMYLSMFWNSVFLVVPIIAGQTLIAALAAYAFSKLRFRGRELLFLVYVLTMLMPFQVTLVPNYIMADRLGLLNSPGGHYSAWHFFAAFGVFMLRQFMLDIPYAYIEAAKMDGAGHLRIFLVPLLFPWFSRV